MTKPTIGVMIATAGRPSLWRTLYSMVHQKDGIEDICIVGDGYCEATELVVHTFADLWKLPCRYLPIQRTSDWGHTQINYAIEQVEGDWVVVQDDDDEFAPRAFEEMRSVIYEQEIEHPIMGRVKTPGLGLLWSQPGQTLLDGHCILSPNNKEKIGRYGLDYAGDQKYLAESCKSYGKLTWADRVWTVTRTGWKLIPMNSIETPEGWSVDMYASIPGRQVGRIVLRWDEHRAFMRIEGKNLTQAQRREMIEYGFWACQSRDCWLEASDPRTGSAASELLFEPHGEHKVHDWPPNHWEAKK